jgi:hypothetical protein
VQHLNGGTQTVCCLAAQCTAVEDRSADALTATRELVSAKAEIGCPLDKCTWVMKRHFSSKLSCACLRWSTSFGGLSRDSGTCGSFKAEAC